MKTSEVLRNAARIYSKRKQARLPVIFKEAATIDKNSLLTQVDVNALAIAWRVYSKEITTGALDDLLDITVIKDWKAFSILLMLFLAEYMESIGD